MDPHSFTPSKFYNSTATEDSKRQYEQYDPNDISINVIGGWVAPPRIQFEVIFVMQIVRVIFIISLNAH